MVLSATWLVSNSINRNSPEKKVIRPLFCVSLLASYRLATEPSKCPRVWTIVAERLRFWSLMGMVREKCPREGHRGFSGIWVTGLNTEEEPVGASRDVHIEGPNPKTGVERAGKRGRGPGLESVLLGGEIH